MAEMANNPQYPGVQVSMCIIRSYISNIILDAIMYVMLATEVYLVSFSYQC